MYYCVIKYGRFNGDVTTNGPFKDEKTALDYRTRWLVNDGEEVPEDEELSTTIDTSSYSYAISVIFKPSVMSGGIR